jgi:hypothetical protein
LIVGFALLGKRNFCTRSKAFGLGLGLGALENYFPGTLPIAHILFCQLHIYFI